MKNLWLWWHLTTFPPTVTDPSLSLQDDVLWSSTSLRGDAYRQSSFWTVARMLFKKTGNRTVTQSEESMILMTSYHFPHHGNRSFAIASGWRLMVFDIASGWRLSSVVILNGGKNAVQKNGKQDSDTEWRIYDSDDILPLSSPQVQSLHIRFGWRLTFSSLQQQILCWYFVWHLMEIICFGF